MISIGSFNVRGLGLSDDSQLKLRDLVSDCKQYKVDILGIQESKNQKGKFDQIVDNHRVILFETEKDKTRKHLGLGFIVVPSLR